MFKSFALLRLSSVCVCVCVQNQCTSHIKDSQMTKKKSTNFETEIWICDLWSYAITLTKHTKPYIKNKIRKKKNYCSWLTNKWGLQSNSYFIICVICSRNWNMTGVPSFGINKEQW